MAVGIFSIKTNMLVIGNANTSIHINVIKEENGDTIYSIAIIPMLLMLNSTVFIVIGGLRNGKNNRRLPCCVFK